MDDVVEVNPLVPPDKWDWFCLDNVPYHGRIITIVWDKTGEKYDKGRGLGVFADGKEIARSDSLSHITAQLPAGHSEKGESGWKKYEGNPVLGGEFGTCFDVAVLREGDKYRMYFSWRLKKSIALVGSGDGIHWGEPRIALGPVPESDWQGRVNRPAVIKFNNVYHMWYTGQSSERSWIGYATSDDGTTWERVSDKPVLSAEQPWEKVALMCPHVIRDEEQGLFRMWYSGGEQYEPDAIGHATSPDGLHWTKCPTNPVFVGDPNNEWERNKVTACQVIRQGEWYVMFYIGFKDVEHAQIGAARSRDGLSNWQRYRENPIISPGKGSWDGDACYKPFAIYEQEKDRWLLWYNGRLGGVEQIGLAIHEGRELGF